MKYQKALKKKSEQALASEIIAAKYCMNPEEVFNWANKYGVKLMEEGHKLTSKKNHMGFLCDVIWDRFDESKALLGR